MKKNIVMLVLSVVVAAGLFASGSREAATIEGKLVVTDSIPQIVANGKTWLLPEGPFYQIAWENNIKVGDTIKVEGFERECPADFSIKNASLLMPSKVWVNGKEIDLSSVRKHSMMGGQPGNRGRGHMSGNDDRLGAPDDGGDAPRN